MSEAPHKDQDPDLLIDTDFEAGQDNVQILGLDVHNPVFFVSAIVIVGFVILTLMFGESAADFFDGLRIYMTNTFDWSLLIAGNLFFLFSLVLIVTPMGSIRLGRGLNSA